MTADRGRHVAGELPLSIAPDIDLSRVQRVADAMFQFRMLS
jgi:hypothetical protein